MTLSVFWGVLCRARRWTLWFLWMPSNSWYSMTMRSVAERRVYLYYFHPQILPQTQIYSLYVFFSNLRVWYFETSMVIRAIEHLWMDTAEDHGNCKVSACGLEATETEHVVSHWTSSKHQGGQQKERLWLSPAHWIFTSGKNLSRMKLASHMQGNKCSLSAKYFSTAQAWCFREIRAIYNSGTLRTLDQDFRI